MNRNELATLSSEEQKAAFRTFSPEKRKQLWLNKLNQIKSLNFSNEEMQHLNTFEIFLNKYDFSKELTNEQEKFLNSWFEEGRLKYNWTSYFLVSGFAKLNEDAVKTKKEFYSNFPNLKARIEGESGSCDCKWDITCQLSGLGECSDPECRETRAGCGWLTMQACDGDCSG